MKISKTQFIRLLQNLKYMHENQDFKMDKKFKTLSMK